MESDVVDGLDWALGVRLGSLGCSSILTAMLGRPGTALATLFSNRCAPLFRIFGEAECWIFAPYLLYRCLGKAWHSSEASATRTRPAFISSAQI
jgi:hypothetical protein